MGNIRKVKSEKFKVQSKTRRRKRVGLKVQNAKFKVEEKEETEKETKTMIQDSKIKQSEIFEKIVRNRNGQLFRVHFIVVERNGVFRGKVISYEEIQELRGCTDAECKHFLLAGNVAKREARISKKGFQPVLSPFYTFDFLTEIKIRAPSLSL
ncbi:MAG: hypothetical protein COV91_03295 [Candidatus Taylorbacteria bacterium CG11_big_fil_rev_8_21_14_0_20_46_11]|uniref:Uncharacterized protein n=1 Tax=Candidatus Taylorbacteria bacterium CG11_big_fil_rev_8_21_14_0_20_46_11 TaxID=1975025 RepID=A0A2H0KBF1_9BACT|nr:MAG: hypothetical protein COV91_03295 [Candidatus Taylorbacteria bacterium CG11_big_fil_rev_8_21_14_0_20_46_11]